jgi:hypothetical protein
MSDIDRLLTGEYLIHRSDCTLIGGECPCGLDRIKHNAAAELEAIRAELSRLQEELAKARSMVEQSEALVAAWDRRKSASLVSDMEEAEDHCMYVEGKLRAALRAYESEKAKGETR